MSVRPPQRVLVLRCPEPCEPEVFERVIAVLARFCPAVEAVEPGVCAFGARGPARYFGGETVLAAKIIAAVADVGVEGRIGIADGLFAALLAARAARPVAARPSTRSARPVADRSGTGRLVTVVPPGGTAEFLAPQPVSVLVDQDQDEDLAGLLHRLGLRTLGDLAALSAADVASRFGDAGEAAHRLARGGSRPLAVRPPDEDLSVAQEFDPPESRSEPVVFAAKALAERMLSGLTARGLTCVRVQVLARWADGRQSSRRWRHDGVLSAVQVADRVRWQLDGHQATLEPAATSPRRTRPRRTSPPRTSPPHTSPPRPGGSRCCGWCPTRWSAPPGASSRCGARPRSATRWRGRPCGYRPCSGPKRCCDRSPAAAETLASR